MIQLKTVLNLLIVFLLACCDETPLSYLHDSRKEGEMGKWTGSWTIYDDDLHTGGGIMLTPSDEHQSVDIYYEDKNAPRGSKVLKYSWDGQDVAGQHIWCGIDLSVASNWRTYDLTPGKNLNQGGYTMITFAAKVILSENTTVEFRGPIPSAKVHYTVSCDWKRDTISLVPNGLKNARDFFVIVFMYSQSSGNKNSGNGGTVYVDDIKYER